MPTQGPGVQLVFAESRRARAQRAADGLAVLGDAEAAARGAMERAERLARRTLSLNARLRDTAAFDRREAARRDRDAALTRLAADGPTPAAMLPPITDPLPAVADVAAGGPGMRQLLLDRRRARAKAAPAADTASAPWPERPDKQEDVLRRKIARTQRTALLFEATAAYADALTSYSRVLHVLALDAADAQRQPAALVIQRYHRASTARAAFRQQRQAALALQRLCRGFVGRRRTAPLHHRARGVLLLQRAGLGFLARLRVRGLLQIDMLRRRRRDSATVIQTSFRRHRAESEFRHILREDRAARRIQLVVRGFVHKVRFWRDHWQARAVDRYYAARNTATDIVLLEHAERGAIRDLHAAHWRALSHAVHQALRGLHRARLTDLLLATATAPRPAEGGSTAGWMADLLGRTRSGAAVEVANSRVPGAAAPVALLEGPASVSADPDAAVVTAHVRGVDGLGGPRRRGLLRLRLEQFEAVGRASIVFAELTRALALRHAHDLATYAWRGRRTLVLESTDADARRALAAAADEHRAAARAVQEERARRQELRAALVLQASGRALLSRRSVAAARESARQAARLQAAREVAAEEADRQAMEQSSAARVLQRAARRMAATRRAQQAVALRRGERYLRESVVLLLQRLGRGLTQRNAVASTAPVATRRRWGRRL